MRNAFDTQIPHFITLTYSSYFFTPPTKWTLRVCLVGVKTKRMKNRERKIGWKMLFSTIWLKKENRRESFPSRPTFFILPIWKENGERKVLRNVFYTNTLSPTPHFIHDLMTCFGLFYFWQHCLFFFLFFFSRVPFFFFLFIIWVETLLFFFFS